MGYKWSKDQYLKYSATMKRKRNERIAKQHAVVAHAIPIDNVVDAATKLQKQHLFLDNLWHTMNAQDKARAIAYLMKDLF